MEDILTLLDGDDFLAADIFVTPPENHLQSDEDSGDEDTCDMNHLTGNQLRAEAELHVSKVGESGIETVIVGHDSCDIDTTPENNLSTDFDNRPSVVASQDDSLSTSQAEPKPSCSSFEKVKKRKLDNTNIAKQTKKKTKFTKPLIKLL